MCLDCVNLFPVNTGAEDYFNETRKYLLVNTLVGSLSLSLKEEEICYGVPKKILYYITNYEGNLKILDTPVKEFKNMHNDIGFLHLTPI
jgi:hypothetical protein